MAKLEDVIAGITEGYRRGRIAFIGDSTIFGTGATLRVRNAVSRLAAILTGRGLPAQADNVWGYMAPGTFMPNLTVGAGWGPATDASAGGFAWLNTTTISPLVFTPLEPHTDTFEVWYFNDTSFGPFQISDGTNTITITPAGSHSLAKATLGPDQGVVRGANTFTIAKASAGTTSQIIGFEAYDSTTPKLALYNMGWFGAKSTDWAVTTNDWSPQAALSFIRPDACIIDLGINDYRLLATPLPAFRAAIQSLIWAAQDLGYVGLVIPEPSDVSATAILNQKSYCDILRSFPDLPITDMPANWWTWVAAYAAGKMSSTLHPNDAGYNEKAILIYQAMFSEYLE